MPRLRVPLVGTFNQRGMDGNAALALNEDQRFLNCLFNVVTNPITGKSTVYFSKRPGWGVDSIVAAGNASTGFIKPLSFNASLSAFGATNSTIYLGTNSVGTITGRAMFFTETIISGTSMVAIKSSDGTGWYFASDAAAQTAYLGDTHSSTTVDNLGSTAGMYPGQAITGSGFQAGTTIASITSSVAIVISLATSTSLSQTAITKTPIAQITSSNFVTTGTHISGFTAVDGYLYYCTDDGNLRNSDLNSISSFTATSAIPVQMSPDPPVAVATQNDTVICLGTASKEVFQNAGLINGSPLQRVTAYFENVGCPDQRGVTQIENDIYFVATPYDGDAGIYRLRALQTSRISTPDVDRIIGNISNTAGVIYASSFRMGGYVYAAFFCSTSSDGPNSFFLLESGDHLLLESSDKLVLEAVPGTAASFAHLLVYNVTLNIWSEWDCQQLTYVDAVGSGGANAILATSRTLTLGKIYTIAPLSQGAVYQDDGVGYNMEIRTAKLDFGTSAKKFISTIRLIADTQTSGTALLEKSDDDYATWQTLGTFDLTRNGPNINRCGSYRGGRAYRLTHSANGPFRGEALEFEYSIGED